MTWFSECVELNGENISLVPLENYHFNELILLAKDKRIWQYYAVDGSDIAQINKSLSEALQEQKNGRQYPFVIINRNENKIIGSTRFLEIQKEHRKLEIGWTWLHPDFWGTKLNTECKLLLLTYCFEKLFTARVQLKTDENNIRSRKAIEKIGGIFEGVFRNDMIRSNGTNRNSAYFSIIESDWMNVKKQLLIHLTE